LSRTINSYNNFKKDPLPHRIIVFHILPTICYSENHEIKLVSVNAIVSVFRREEENTYFVGSLR
jgi:hypothetical protein